MNSGELKEKLKVLLEEFSEHSGVFPSSIKANWVSISGTSAMKVSRTDIEYQDNNKYF